MVRIELTAVPDPRRPFCFWLGDLVRARLTGREGHIVTGRYLGPLPTTGVALAYAIEYVVHPERGLDFGALEVDLDRRPATPMTPVGRRRVIGLLSVALLAAPLVVEAQQPTMPVIGFVRTSSIEAVPHMVAAFRQGLKDMGYVEGQNVAIEFRSADDRYDKLAVIIAELIRRPVAVLVGNDGAARAAKAATTTVPIVFATGGDPVRGNLVVSLNRPGGNVTGVSFLGSLGGKKLELIRALASKSRAIGVMENPNSLASQTERIEVETAARAVGQRVIVLKASVEQNIDTAFTTLVHQHVGALLVTGDALFTGRQDKLVALAARHAIPAIYSQRDYVAAGGLMSYGTSITDAYRQVGVYAGRILKGEKPADLPVVRPTKFELVINMKTAKALDLTIPPSLLAGADEVIQ